MLPNMEDSPRLKSITKNNTAQTWDPGISKTASVNTIKARPVPEALLEREIKVRQKKMLHHVQKECLVFYRTRSSTEDHSVWHD